MALNNTVQNLRERPRDQRKVIAGGVAIGAIVILFLGWAFFFFHRIQNTQSITSESAQTAAAGTATLR